MAVLLITPRNLFYTKNMGGELKEVPFLLMIMLNWSSIVMLPMKKSKVIMDVNDVSRTYLVKSYIMYLIVVINSCIITIDLMLIIS